MAHQFDIDKLNDKADAIRWKQHMYHEEQMRLEIIINDFNASEDMKNKSVERIAKLDKKIDKLDKKLCRILQKLAIISNISEEEYNAYAARYEDEGYDHRYEIVGDEY